MFYLNVNRLISFYFPINCTTTAFYCSSLLREYVRHILYLFALRFPWYLQYFQHLQYDVPAPVCWSCVQNCHQFQHQHGAAETISCLQDAAPQLTNANSRLTAWLMNLLVNWPSWPVVLMHSRCFSLCPSASKVYSPTQLPIQQQPLIASSKMTLDNFVSAPVWPVFCPDVTRQCDSSWSSGVAQTLTQWDFCWHCSFLSQWPLLHAQERVLITSSQSNWIYEDSCVLSRAKSLNKYRTVGRWRQGKGICPLGLFALLY